ncbi:lysophospholipid acyltransferase family protein [Nocardioides sp.]|uniref:lysophospholipid acyltransferase family protein n=1 Tax=Nocardioides sp. TaxID=35761 RepID=UPI0035667E2F
MKEPWYDATVVLARTAMAGLGLTTRWSGEENVPESGPVLLASVHNSYPDFLFVGKAALSRGRHVRFMCRHDIWHVPVVRRAMDAMRHIPVDRQAPAAAYLRARRLLADGEAVGVFPEAGISHSFTVRSLMPGTVALARETGVPIVPVALWGGQRIATVSRTPEGRERPPELARGRLVDVRFGAPLPVAADEDLAEATHRLGHALTDLLEGLQRLPAHRPRAGEHAPWHPAHLGGHAPDRRAALDLDEVPSSAVPPSWGPPVRPSS